MRRDMKSWDEYIEMAREEKDRKAWEKVLSTEEGRWVYSRIMEKSAYRGRSFTGNSFTFRNEGRREVAIEINEDMVHLLGFRAVELRQLAEREYIDFTMKQDKLFHGKKDGS